MLVREGKRGSGLQKQRERREGREAACMHGCMCAVLGAQGTVAAC